MQHIGASLLEDNIADILATLPEGLHPWPQNHYLSPYQQIQANRPTYTYSFRIHPDRLEEDVHSSSRVWNFHCCTPSKFVKRLMNLFLHKLHSWAGNIWQRKPNDIVPQIEWKWISIAWGHVHTCPYPKPTTQNTSTKDTCVDQSQKWQGLTLKSCSKVGQRCDPRSIWQRNSPKIPVHPERGLPLC